MKKINSSLLVLVALLTMTSLPAFAQMADPESVFEGMPDVAYPIPSDGDVLHTLGKATKSQLPPKHWSFLVWNLHKGEDATFRQDYLSLAFNRDIIMNQEIALDENMSSVFSVLPRYLFETATSFFYGAENVRTGVANISPVAPDSSKYVRTVNMEPVIHSPKVALITTYPIRFSTKKLTVVNIHGINFVTNPTFKAELERLYQNIKDLPSPLIFAGDFNTWNAERLSILSEYAKKLNLSEARFLPDDRLTFNGNPLDHFLYTSDLKITKARVDGKYMGSDHKPLEVEVEYIRSPEDKKSTDEESDDSYQVSL